MIKQICCLAASTQSWQFIETTNSRAHASEQSYTQTFFPGRAPQHRSDIGFPSHFLQCSILFILGYNQIFLKSVTITLNGKPQPDKEMRNEPV